MFQVIQVEQIDKLLDNKIKRLLPVLYNNWISMYYSIFVLINFLIFEIFGLENFINEKSSILKIKKFNTKNKYSI